MTMAYGRITWKASSLWIVSVLVSLASGCVSDRPSRFPRFCKTDRFVCQRSLAPRGVGADGALFGYHPTYWRAWPEPYVFCPPPHDLDPNVAPGVAHGVEMRIRPTKPVPPKPETLPAQGPNPAETSPPPEPPSATLDLQAPGPVEAPTEPEEVAPKALRLRDEPPIAPSEEIEPSIDNAPDPPPAEGPGVSSQFEDPGAVVPEPPDTGPQSDAVAEPPDSPPLHEEDSKPDPAETVPAAKTSLVPKVLDSADSLWRLVRRTVRSAASSGRLFSKRRHLD